MLARLKYKDIYSDSEEENSVPPSNGVALIMPPKGNNFGVVKFPTKKKYKYYIERVIQVYDDNILEVKFLREAKSDSFVFPAVDDVSVIDMDDVDAVLKEPEIDKRGHHIFKSIPKK